MSLEARRKAARETGYCGICVTNRATAGNKTCAACRERSTENRRKHSYAIDRNRGRVQVKAWNICCQASGFHRDGCNGDITLTAEEIGTLEVDTGPMCRCISTPSEFADEP